MIPIKVAVVYKGNEPILSGDYFAKTYYNFFMVALKRSNFIELKYFPTDKVFDLNKINEQIDVILLPASAIYKDKSEIISLKGEVEVVNTTQKISYYGVWEVNHLTEGSKTKSS